MRLIGQLLRRALKSSRCPINVKSLRVVFVLWILHGVYQRNVVCSNLGNNTGF